MLGKLLRVQKMIWWSNLFIDEIHRFSKSQQDSLLGAVEKGIITLIGATTENTLFRGYFSSAFAMSGLHFKITGQKTAFIFIIRCKIPS